MHTYIKSTNVHQTKIESETKIVVAALIMKEYEEKMVYNVKCEWVSLFGYAGKSKMFGLQKWYRRQRREAIKINTGTRKSTCNE